MLFRYPAIRRLVCRGPWLNPDVIDSPETAELAEIDDDVAAEEERLRQGDESAMVRVLGLRKVYAKRDARNRRTKFSAVKDLWFSIPRGEVFGFLGVNGAGKSTTLKIISGDVLPTRGTAQMGGLDILNQQVAVRRLLGYCPQTNALLPLLSVREHLSLFARIKGVPWGEVNAVVERRIQQLDLVEFRNKLAGTLSGGNKRKLCVAIALIGEPVRVRVIDVLRVSLSLSLSLSFAHCSSSPVAVANAASLRANRTHFLTPSPLTHTHTHTHTQHTTSHTTTTTTAGHLPR
jgi:ABC-type Na+ transport system ATPase subunit NatA